MALPAILAALGPAMGALKGAGASAMGAAGGFAKAHPMLTKTMLQGLGGGIASQLGNDDEMYNMYIQQLMAQRNNQGQQQIGSQSLPGTIVN